MCQIQRGPGSKSFALRTASPPVERGYRPQEKWCGVVVAAFQEGTDTLKFPEPLGYMQPALEAEITNWKGKNFLARFEYNRLADESNRSRPASVTIA